MTLSVVPALQSPASAAITGAQFPTMSVGQDGSDVRALQYIMAGHGWTQSITGTYDQQTHDNIIAWQAFTGQTANGVAYPSMMTSPFVPYIDVNGSPNANHVRAVQTLLQKVYVGYVTVDGNWNATTKSQVQAFQTHIGEPATGNVDITTWKHLFWHFANIPDGSSGICWKSGENGSEQWGTAAVYSDVRQSGSRFVTEVAYVHGWYGNVAIGDLGYEHGGDHTGHESHEKGLDADVRLIRNDTQQCTYGVSYTDAAYSLSGTLLQSYVFHQDAGPYSYYLKLIYFNDPNVQYWWPKVTSYADHDNHFHVRYCTQSPAPTSSYLC